VHILALPTETSFRDIVLSGVALSRILFLPHLRGLRPSDLIDTNPTRPFFDTLILPVNLSLPLHYFQRVRPRTNPAPKLQLFHLRTASFVLHLFDIVSSLFSHQIWFAQRNGLDAIVWTFSRVASAFVVAWRIQLASVP